jgi:Protein of unknown function (DUF2628)
MSVYTVHEPPPRNGAVVPNPERFVFVRDGFYLWAFLLTPLWLLWHRLWLVLLIYLVAMFGLEQAMRYAGADAAGRSLVMLLIAFLIGLEASTLRRFTLARRGWRNVGLVSGTNMEAAERRFFNDWAAPGQGRSSGGAGHPPPLPPSPAPTFHAPPIVGLFPEPGASR